MLDDLVLTSRRNPGTVSVSMSTLILVRKGSYVNGILIESVGVTAGSDEDPVSVLECGLYN